MTAPRPPDDPPPFPNKDTTTTTNPIPSSSPAFGTPAYPIASRPARAGGVASKFPPAFPSNRPTTTIATTPAVLPILLPPATLRPLAFRTISKKYGFTISSLALQSLAIFIGRYCGSRWREDGLAERVLDEVAKAWKRNSGGVILDDSTSDKKLGEILKQLELCMTGGRVDTGRLSRSSSGLAGSGKEARRPSAPSRHDTQSSLSRFGGELEEDETRIGISDGEGPSSSKQDARSYIKVISAFDQPRFTYSTSKKSLDHVTTPASLFPPPSYRIAMFRNRYHLVHQRLMRNESFQTPSFSTTGKSGRTLSRSDSSLTSVQQAYKITPISNLLGRSGSSHLLLGLLAISPTTGDLALTDLTGSITLDLSAARPVPEDAAWFCPGTIVLIEGIYDEDGSNTGGGVGGMIGGRFFGSSIGGPPAERREVTIGTGSGNGGASGVDNNNPSPLLSAGAGFGWTDFLGVGSERAYGQSMRRLQRKILGHRRRAGQNAEAADGHRARIAILGECHLDSPRTLEGIRRILSSYTTATAGVKDSGSSSSTSPPPLPLCLVFMGNFVSKACMAGANANSNTTDAAAGGISYKEQFDSLAAVLSEFPTLLSSTTLIFIPGDNDPWPSASSAGAATPLPRDKLPDMFTSRIRRVVHTANLDAGKAAGSGEAVWMSNPARISCFGPVEELVLFRDDISGRLRRSAVRFSPMTDSGGGDGEDELSGAVAGGGGGRGGDPMDLDRDHDQDMNQLQDDPAIHQAESHLPQPSNPSNRPKAQPSNQQTPHLPPTTTTFSDLPSRKLIKTIIDQSHLSPFPLSTRPVLWDYASTLQLYPLPTALVLADAEVAPFAITYEGCCVLNPGKVVGVGAGTGGGGTGREVGGRGMGGGGGGSRGVVRWVEYDLRTKGGLVRRLRL